MYVNAAQRGANPFIPSSQPLTPDDGKGGFADLFTDAGNADLARFEEAMRKKGFNHHDVQRALTDYRQWLKKNPKPSAGQRLAAQRAAVVRAYWKELSGDSRFITQDSLKKVIEAKDLPDFVLDAAKYFHQPANFRRVDQAGTNPTIALDGHASKDNFEYFLANLDGSQDQTTADFQDQLDAEIEAGLPALNDSDYAKIVAKPGDYTVDQRLRALLELERAHNSLDNMVGQGWGARDRSVLDNFKAKIKALNQDPELKKRRLELQKKAAEKLLEKDPSLKAALEARFTQRLQEIESGDVIRRKKGSHDIDLDATLNDGELMHLAGVLGKDPKVLSEAFTKGLKKATEKDPGLKNLLEARYAKKLQDIEKGDVIRRMPNSHDIDLDATLDCSEMLLLGGALGKDTLALNQSIANGLKAAAAKDPGFKALLTQRYEAKKAETESGKRIQWDSKKTWQENLEALKQVGSEASFLARVLGVDAGEMSTARFTGIKAFFKNNPGVKELLEDEFKKLQNAIATGSNLKWDASVDALTNLNKWQAENKQAFELAQVLGHGFNKLDFEKGLKAVNGGKYFDAVVTQFKDDYASGKRLQDLRTTLKDKGKDPKDAASQYLAEIAVFELALGSDVRANGDERARARMHAVGDVMPSPTLSQFEQAFGSANGEFDTARAEALYDEILKQNPAAFRDTDGSQISKAKAVQIFAELWAAARELAKTKGKPDGSTPLDIVTLLKSPRLSAAADWMNTGKGHIVMGVLGGIALIGHGAEGNLEGGRATLGGIASGIVASSDILEGVFRVKAGPVRAENGASIIAPEGAESPESIALRTKYRAYENYFKRAGAGGNGVLGVLSVLDAGDAFARGDHVQGARSLASGTLSLIDAGLTLAESFGARIGGLVGWSGAVGALYFIADTIVDFAQKAGYEGDAKKALEATAKKFGIALAPDEGVERNAQRAQEIEQSTPPGPGVSPRGGGGIRE